MPEERKIIGYLFGHPIYETPMPEMEGVEVIGKSWEQLAYEKSLERIKPVDEATLPTGGNDDPGVI
jgi:hypothetical protein